MILAHIVGKKFVGEEKMPNGRMLSTPSGGFTEA
jgi:hypothetical protein